MSGLFRIFVPSVTSFFVSLGITLIILIGRTLALSLDSGLLLPNLLQGDTELWGLFLIGNVEPIVRLITENQIAATLSIALAWAIFGGIMYAFVSSVACATKEARNIQDPTMSFYLRILIWHIVVGSLMAGLTFLILPFISWLIAQNDLLNQSATLPELLSYTAIIIGGWMGTFHLYVVLYRLSRRFYIA